MNNQGKLMFKKKIACELDFQPKAQSVITILYNSMPQYFDGSMTPRLYDYTTQCLGATTDTYLSMTLLYESMTPWLHDSMTSWLYDSMTSRLFWPVGWADHWHVSFHEFSPWLQYSMTTWIYDSMTILQYSMTTWLHYYSPWWTTDIYLSLNLLHDSRTLGLNDSMTPWLYSMTPGLHDSRIPWPHDSRTQWIYSSTPWLHDSMTPWLYEYTPWLHDYMTPWLYDSMNILHHSMTP